MKKFTNEIKTGLVVVVALLIGFLLWAKTATFDVQSYRLKTYFTSASGIKENATVTLAGIETGRVEKVDFVYEPETKVEVTLLLERGARVRRDSLAYIGTAGFVGDSFIGITAGKSKIFLENGDTIKSEDPVEMRELMRRADAIAQNLDVILSDVKTIVSDNKDKVDNIVVNLEQTTENFNEFSEDIKQNPWKLLFKGKER
jgi:phospholipid/cholesterol/gamma-HCH transport system substrate-binding protein